VNPILFATINAATIHCRSDHWLAERARENKGRLIDGKKMMRGLVAIVLMALISVVAAQAGELRIIETEEGITAEYTGTAAEAGEEGKMPGESDKPSANGSNADKIQQQTVRELPKIADSPKPSEKLPVTQKNYRQERKTQMKALRKSSSTSSPSSANLE